MQRPFVGNCIVWLSHHGETSAYDTNKFHGANSCDFKVFSSRNKKIGDLVLMGKKRGDIGAIGPTFEETGWAPIQGGRKTIRIFGATYAYFGNNRRFTLQGPDGRTKTAQKRS